MDHLIETGGFLIQPQDLQKGLQQGELLVDFFQIPPASVGESGSYGAILFQSGETPKLVSLGSAGLIDTLVLRYRNLMTGQGDFALDSLETLNEKTDQVIAETYGAVLKPLMPHLEGSRKILFSP